MMAGEPDQVRLARSNFHRTRLLGGKCRENSHKFSPPRSLSTPGMFLAAFATLLFIATVDEARV